MIRIGDFSKLSRVSVKTLRYYDEMGLLKPVEVDRFTGYRLYEYSQLSALNRSAGPCREVYLKPARSGSQTDPETVTEIQFPVEKN